MSFNLFITKISENITIILNELRDKFSNLEITGPTFRHREFQQSLSFIIYPLINDILEIKLILKSRINDFIQSKLKEGEAIFYGDSNNGEIIDSGLLAFTIEEANHWEYYSYLDESFIYCRLLLIVDFVKKKKWLSLYIDENEKSSWFSDGLMK